MYAWDAISIPFTYFGGPIGIGVQQIAGLGVPLTFKKFSRNAEIEADLLGIEYQYAAGYDPEAYVQALEKLQKRESFMHKRMAKLPGYRVMDKLPMHQLLAITYLTQLASGSSARCQKSVPVQAGPAPAGGVD